jgi:sulfate transport system permease protein
MATAAASSSRFGAGVPSGGLSLRAVAVGYLAVMLVIPLAAVVADAFSAGVAGFWESLSRPDARAALVLTVWTAAVMAIINAVFGTITAYVLVRYEFPGRALVNTLIDIPFAIPTLITGVMLVALFGPNSAVGGFLTEYRIPIIYAPPGIVLALLFTTFPFVVRSVQPVLLEIDADQEEAARTLGASEWQTFRHVLFPGIRPAVLGGTLLAFARALGEFGSIVMVAGNIPMHTQTAAVWVLKEIESENRRGAGAMSVVLLVASFALIFTVDRLERRNRRRRPV